MMIPIIICSLLAITISIERLIYFKKFRSSRHAPKMLALMEEGKFIDAVAVAERTHSPSTPGDLHGNPTTRQFTHQSHGSYRHP